MFIGDGNQPGSEVRVESFDADNSNDLVLGIYSTDTSITGSNTHMVVKYQSSDGSYPWNLVLSETDQ